MNKVVAQWIPAHTGLLGNDKADKLAKQGSKMQQPSVPTTYKEIKTIIKYDHLKEWRNQQDYTPAQDAINRLDRQGQTTIFRLRTGHCGLRNHMAKMGLTETAACPCGFTQQTVEHILQMCPHLEQLREETWTVPTFVHQKLFGDLSALRRTMQFVTASGLKI